jgi:hypothetical protein
LGVLYAGLDIGGLIFASRFDLSKVQ